ncbi:MULTISPECIES: hypothetical protein [unclassified Streptomyces]|uniref:hypothetical protein n=1 Tax=unclassified Streptomyces TaxID=2593676 RepID=UPI0035DA034B
MHSSGRDEALGTCSDHDLVVFLEGAGVAAPEAVLDDPQWVEWRGGHAHKWVRFPLSELPRAGHAATTKSGW